MIAVASLIILICGMSVLISVVNTCGVIVGTNGVVISPLSTVGEFQKIVCKVHSEK